MLRAIYSTIREDDIARVVDATYSLGQVETCHLIRRGFNDVYALRVNTVNTVTGAPFAIFCRVPASLDHL